MTSTFKAMLNAAAALGLFSVAGTGMVVLVHHHTEARIVENQRQALLHTLQNLLPAATYDNDVVSDAVAVNDPALGPRPTTVYRARKQGRPVAAVLTPIAPDGYAGDVRLLVAVRADGRLFGVRVLSHGETPGLGDLIDEKKSRWIFGFDGLSLAHPPESLWKVKRDGGAFDQFTGATVTPRAVVKAVKRTLIYFDAHQTALFSETNESKVTPPGSS